MTATVVYWLFDQTCKDPTTDGYIGLSGSLSRRLRTHRKSGRFPIFEYRILFTGTRAEAAAFELSMRPQPEIGWNMLAGGFAGRVAGPSTRAKMRASAKRARAEHPLAKRHQIKVDILGRLATAMRAAAAQDFTARTVFHSDCVRNAKPGNQKVKLLKTKRK